MYFYVHFRHRTENFIKTTFLDRWQKFNSIELYRVSHSMCSMYIILIYRNQFYLRGGGLVLNARKTKIFYDNFFSIEFWKHVAEINSSRTIILKNRKTYYERIECPFWFSIFGIIWHFFPTLLTKWSVFILDILSRHLERFFLRCFLDGR